jgi:hypothetical protein
MLGRGLRRTLAPRARNNLAYALAVNMAFRKTFQFARSCMNLMKIVRGFSPELRP